MYNRPLRPLKATGGAAAQSLWVVLGFEPRGLEIKKNVLPCIYNDAFILAEGYFFGESV